MSKGRFIGQASSLRVPDQKPEPKVEEVQPEERTLKVYAEIPESLYEKLQDYTFYAYYNQSEIIKQAIEEFLDRQEIKPRPDVVKKRKKPGRPRAKR
jgi:hypothetical protein